MKNELEDKLFTRFPTIFPNGRQVDPMQSLICFGLDCHDGWFDLIWELCLELEKIGDKIVCVQAKEKFGGLRFYLNPIPDEPQYKEVFDIINKYEEASYKMCEVCGEKGKLRDDMSWWQTLCTKHYKEKLNHLTKKQLEWKAKRELK